MNSRIRRLGVTLAAAVALTGTGATATTDEPLFSPNPYPHSAVIDWVDVMLESIERNPPAPTATTWRMWVVLSSMYDAWTAYDPNARATDPGFDVKRPAFEHTPENKRQAVSYAAYNTLNHVFPEQGPIFDAVMELQGLEPRGSVDVTTPAGVGNVAADRVIRTRSRPGANAHEFDDTVSTLFAEPYQPAAVFDANHWVPLRVPTGVLRDGHGVPVWSPDRPESYEVQQFLTPHWGSTMPFALERGDQFRPPAPPRLGSSAPYTDALGLTTSGDEAYRAQAAAVLEFSSALDDERKVIAEFWADGPHTWTPPGHWIQLAIGVSLRDRHDLDQDVCLYMALAGALLDAGIAAWDAKRAHDYVRPVTAIRYLYADDDVYAWRGPDQGLGRIRGSEWRPYQASTFVTPPFAEYVSGHSAFSAAAAEVLTGYTGSGRMYDGSTHLGRDYDGDGADDLLGRHVANPGSLIFESGPQEQVILRWETFREAADEAGISRLYGGIHFQDGDLRGRELGRAVGRQALEHARSLWEPAT
ncbi:MAG: vanadium-dependent haloperoxidase [Chloroflexota bacterium]|jgi:membrane-associated phospholipid phosphatase